MLRLIITADDNLYDRLTCRTPEQGCVSQRATNVLDGYRLAMTEPVNEIILDMSLHAADTLVETLHNRPPTAEIPVYVIESGERLPLALRRLCTDVLEADAL